MDKLILLNKIKSLYEKDNVNIMKWLRKENDEKENDIADILISYDFQAGTYIEEYLSNKESRDNYLLRLSGIIDSLEEENKSILECGVGEATILVPLLNLLKRRFSFIGGVDISWSRKNHGIKFASKYCKSGGVSLAVGDMFNLPCSDNSFDIVFTRQAIEPNRGKEREILSELYRVANNYLILIEPAYELVDAESRKRMDEFGYITNLYGAAKELKLNIVLWELYGKNEVEKNPVGIMIIEKKHGGTAEAGWSCPVTKTKLRKIENAYFSEESLLAYPIMNDVPCLTRDNAVVATKLNYLCYR